MTLLMADKYLLMDRARLEKEFSFEEWMQLSNDEKRFIYKNIWNPGRPDIGAATREEILQRFKQSLDFPEDRILKLHYSYFGACVGAIHIVVRDADCKVPSHFAWLPVNKGVFMSDRIKWRWNF